MWHFDLHKLIRILGHTKRRNFQDWSTKWSFMSWKVCEVEVKLKAARVTRKRFSSHLVSPEYEGYAWGIEVDLSLEEKNGYISPSNRWMITAR